MLCTKQLLMCMQSILKAKRPQEKILSAGVVVEMVVLPTYLHGATLCQILIDGLVFVWIFMLYRCLWFKYSLAEQSLFGEQRQ